MNLSCGKIKQAGAPGVLGMSVADLRKLIVELYTKEKKNIPTLKGLNRDQLCDLLKASYIGTAEIVQAATEQKTAAVTKKTPLVAKKTPISTKTPLVVKTDVSIKPIMTNKTCSTQSKHATDPRYMCNPLTGNWIKIGGTTYNSLVQQGVIKAVTTAPKVDITTTEQAKLQCDKLGGLLNEMSSCYMDSTLLSLLIKDNEYINKYILNADLTELKIVINKGTPKEKTVPISYQAPEFYTVTWKIQVALQDIKSSIQTGKVKTCSLLRKHFDDHQKLYVKHIGPLTQINWLNAQQEPLDVMLRLDTIFNLPDVAKVSLASYGANQPSQQVEVTKMEKNVPVKIITDVFSIADISGQKIINKNKPQLLAELINTSTITELGACNYFLSADRKKAFKIRIEKLKLLETPFLYIHLNRVADQAVIGGKGKVKITTQVVPVAHIKLEDQSKLDLISIIVHYGGADGGHYISYLKCENLWYLYNDLGYKGLTLIGDEKALLTSKGEEIYANATDYFYM